MIYPILITVLMIGAWALLRTVGAERQRRLIELQNTLARAAHSPPHKPKS